MLYDITIVSNRRLYTHSTIKPAFRSPPTTLRSPYHYERHPSVNSTRQNNNKQFRELYSILFDILLESRLFDSTKSKSSEDSERSYDLLRVELIR